MEPENKPSPLPAVLTAVLAIGIVAAVIRLGLDFAVTMLAPRFEGRETITLSDRSGPDVGVPGSAARTEELDRLSLLVGMVYPHWEKEVEDPGSGPIVRVRVKTPLPWHTRRELRSIRRDYEAGDPWPEIRALAVGDYAKRPFGVEFDEPSAGVPVEPRFLRYARRIVASPREIVVPRLLEYALANPGDYAFEDGLDLLTVHVLLCAALRVPDVPSTNAWQGVRLANERADFQGRTSDGWWGWWNDEPDRDARIAAFWTPYRDALGSPAPRRLAPDAAEPEPTVVRGGVPVASYWPEALPEGHRPRLADFYGFLATTNGVEQIFARADPTGRFVVPCRADTAPERIRLGPRAGVVVELAPGATDAALATLLSRIDAPPPTRVHVVPVKALDPGPSAAPSPAESQSQAESAETAKPESHAESAETAGSESHAESAETAGSESHAESAETAEPESHAESAEGQRP